MKLKVLKTIKYGKNYYQPGDIVSVKSSEIDELVERGLAEKPLVVRGGDLVPKPVHAHVVPVPAPEPAPEPAEEPAPEPAEEPAPEPAEEPAPEPAEEPAPEPAEEPAPEPTRSNMADQFKAINGINDDIAKILIDNGYKTIEDLANADFDALVALPCIGKKKAKSITSQAIALI